MKDQKTKARPSASKKTPQNSRKKATGKTTLAPKSAKQTVEKLQKQRNQPPKHYIAYGSNLNLMQMRHRCPTAKIVGAAELHDYELVFRGSRTGNYLSIDPHEGGTVPVLIWEVQHSDELSLDRYEGYPNFYGKEDMTVVVNGVEMSAMVYTLDESHALGMPSIHYVSVVKGGYETAGFDVEILRTAILRTLDKQEMEPPQLQMGGF